MMKTELRDFYLSRFVAMLRRIPELPETSFGWLAGSSSSSSSTAQRTPASCRTKSDFQAALD